jgi:hypothetical protein
MDLATTAAMQSRSPTLFLAVQKARRRKLIEQISLRIEFRATTISDQGQSWSRSETDSPSKQSAWGIGRIAHFLAIAGC